MGKPRGSSPQTKINVTSKSPVGDISVVTLIRPREGSQFPRVFPNSKLTLTRKQSSTKKAPSKNPETLALNQSPIQITPSKLCKKHWFHSLPFQRIMEAQGASDHFKLSTRVQEFEVMGKLLSVTVLNQNLDSLLKPRERHSWPMPRLRSLPL